MKFAFSEVNKSKQILYFFCRTNIQILLREVTTQVLFIIHFGKRKYFWNIYVRDSVRCSALSILAAGTAVTVHETVLSEWKVNLSLCTSQECVGNGIRVSVILTSSQCGSVWSDHKLSIFPLGKELQVLTEKEAACATEAEQLFRTDIFLIPDRNLITIPCIFSKFILLLDSQAAPSMTVTRIWQSKIWNE
jgi:hypothetical protein